MTAQREVIDAFFNGENAPRVASNFQMEVSPDETRAYLVSLRGPAYVLAKREPIQQFTVWNGNLFMDSYARTQHRKVLYFAANREIPAEEDAPPEVGEVSETFGVFTE